MNKNIVVALTLTGLLLAAQSPANIVSVTYNTPGSFTWTCPDGVTSVKVECWGGGSQGGGGNNSNRTGGGGGGGAYARVDSLTVVPGTNYVVFVGGGGVQTVYNNTSVKGTNSWFSNTVTAVVVCLATNGAAGAGNVTGTPAAGGAGGAISGCIGDVKYSGGQGADGSGVSGTGFGGGGGGSGGTTSPGNYTVTTSGTTGATAVTGGGGGGTGWGGGTAGLGTAGTAPGGGGGASFNVSNGGAKIGGSGANGQVVLTYDVDAPPLRWAGGDGNWDFVTTNWVDAATGTTNRVYVANTPLVTFDDSATNFSVALNTNVSPGSVMVSNTTAYTISGSGVISGAAALTKSGAGLLTLATTNTYTGGTVISNGTLTLAVWGALAAGAPVTVSGGTLRMGVAGAIPDNTPLTMTGGALDKNGQALTLSSLSGTGGTITNDTTLTVNQSVTTTFAGSITGAGSVTKTGAGGLTLAGSITGTGSVTNSGTGMLTLAASNSFSGGVTYNNATLTVGAAGALGSGLVTSTGAGTLTFNTPTAATFTNNMILNGSASSALANLGTSTITLNGNLAVTGSGSYEGITGVGAGGFVLGGSNTFSLRFVIMNTSVTLASQYAVASVSQSRITLGDLGGTNSALYLANGVTNKWPVNDSGTGPVTTSGAIFTVGMQVPGTSTFAAGSNLRQSSDTGTFTWQFEADSGASCIFAGVIGNTDTNAQAPIIKIGAGTVEFSGTNTYGGTTTVANGLLQGVVGGSCSNSAVTVAATSGNTAALGVSIANNTKQWTCTNLTTTVNGGANPVLDFNFGSVAPSASVPPLNVIGAATFTTTPTVTVELGAVSTVTAGNSYPLMAWGSTNGTAPTAVTVTTTTARTTISAHLVPGSTTLTLVIDSIATTEPIRWAAVPGNGTWDTNTANWKDNTNGATAFIAGDQVRFDDTYVTADPTVTLNTTVTPSAVTVSNAGYNYTISGSGAMSGAGTLTKTGPGSLTLATTNSYSGGTVISNGTVTLGVAGGIPDNTALTMTGGALDKNGLELTLSLLSGTGGTITNNTVMTVNQSAPTTFAGSITGAGSVSKTGAGMLTLAASNSFSGGLTYNNATLTVGAAGALGSGPVTSTGNGTLTFNTPTAATFTNNMNLNAAANNALANLGASTITLNGNLTVAGQAYEALTGTGVGTGGFVLGGSNNFSGGRFVIKNTSVTLANPDAANAPGFQRVSLGDSGGTASAVYLANGITYSYVVLDSANVGISNCTFYVGMQSAGSAAFSGTGSSGTAVDLQHLSNNIPGNSWNFVATNGATCTFSGNIVNSWGGAQPITKIGAGTVVFGGTNTYAGTTTISAGELIGVTTGSCSNSAFTVASGATNGVQLDATGDQWTCNGLTYNAGNTCADFDFNSVAPSTTIAPLNAGALTANGTVNILLRNVTFPTLTTFNNYPLIHYAGTDPLVSSFSLGTAPPPAVTNAVTGLVVDAVNKNVAVGVQLLVPNLNYTNAPGTTRQITLADLLTNGLASSQGSPGYSITVPSATSAQGGSVITNAGGSILLYTPAGTPASDSFSYTVSDGVVSATATVNITFQAQASGSNPQISVTGGVVNGTLYGIPDSEYDIQRSTNLTVGAGWQTLSSPPLSNAPPYTADPAGRINFTDTNPPPTSGYYRTIQH